MNPLLRWLTSPEWTHVVGALLHSLWQGAILAIALAVLMRRLTNPVTRYRCALGMLGGLVVAGIITWAILNAPKPATPIASPNPAAESEFASTPTTGLDLNSTDKVVVVGKMSLTAAPTNWTAWLALVWLVGAVTMLLRAGIKVAGAEKLRRSCKPLNDCACGGSLPRRCLGAKNSRGRHGQTHLTRRRRCDRAHSHSAALAIQHADTGTNPLHPAA